jgi:hypothetical protein
MFESSFRSISFSVPSSELLRDLRVNPRQTKRPPGNSGGLFSRENSSNGGKAIRTFWTKSYGCVPGVSRIFSALIPFGFNDIQNCYLHSQSHTFSTAFPLS